MAAPKPLASLSSGLLARPGTAKPAMRPQAFNNTSLEDLGWNDMGNVAPVAPALTPMTAQAPVAKRAPLPPVLAERAKLAGAVAKAKSRTKPVAAAGDIRKAAFTLRLDADRHLRLRLASAVDGRSSQQLVVEALDAFLAAQPEVEALARQVPNSQRVPAEK